MSYECQLENNHLLLSFYSADKGDGTTSSVSAAAIAGAEYKGVRIKWRKLKQNPDDDRDTREARRAGDEGREVMLTKSERERRAQNVK